MDKKTLWLWRELLVTQINHFSIYPIVFAAGVILNEEMNCGLLNPLLWMLAGLVSWGLYFVRERIRNSAILVLWHLLALVYTLLLPMGHIFYKIVTIIVNVIYCIRSISMSGEFKKKSTTIIMPIMIPILSGGSILALTENGYSDWILPYVAWTVGLLCGYFVAYYLANYIQVLTVNESSTGHIPKRNIFFSGLKLLAGYLSIGVLATIIICNFVWLEYLVEPIKKVVFAVFGWVGTLIIKIIKLLFGQDFPVSDEVLPRGEMAAMQEGNPVGNRIITIVILLFLGYLLWKCIVSFTQFLRGRIARKSKEEVEKKESLDVREILRKEKGKKKRLFAPLSYEERIRKYYKKKLKTEKVQFGKDGEEEILSRYTVRESAKVLEKPNMVQYYEKARYSDMACNKADVAGMKEACK